MLLAAKVWTYWISFFLIAGGIGLVVATIVGYLVKVQSLKNPRRSRFSGPGRGNSACLR